MLAEVYQIYGRHSGHILELRTVQGLNAEAPHPSEALASDWSVMSRTASQPLALPDAKSHPERASCPKEWRGGAPIPT
jgi:signal transduction protein with GAF and PtsI domain